MNITARHAPQFPHAWPLPFAPGSIPTACLRQVTVGAQLCADILGAAGPYGVAPVLIVRKTLAEVRNSEALAALVLIARGMMR